MFIQVRSVLLSHEWDVMVEPSTEASFPTSMLVQLSTCGWSVLAADEKQTDRTTIRMNGRVRQQARFISASFAGAVI